MPSASDELRARWMTDDETKPYDQLRGRCRIGRDGTIRPIRSVDLTGDDYSAIDYLCDEWDYGFSPKPIELEDGRLFE